MYIIENKKENKFLKNTINRSIGKFKSICILSIEDMINPNLACKVKGYRFDLILIPKIFIDDYEKTPSWKFILPSLLYNKEKNNNIAYY